MSRHISRPSRRDTVFPDFGQDYKALSRLKFVQNKIFGCGISNGAADSQMNNRGPRHGLRNLTTSCYDI